MKLEVEQGDQRQAGRHGAASEFGKRIIEKKDLAPDVLALGREAVDASGAQKVDLQMKDVNDLGEGTGRSQVDLAKTQRSRWCRSSWRLSEAARNLIQRISRSCRCIGPSLALYYMVRRSKGRKHTAPYSTPRIHVDVRQERCIPNTCNA